MKLSLSFLNKFDFIGILLIRVGAGAAISFRGFPLLIAGPEEWSNTGRVAGMIGLEGFYVIWGLVAIILESFGGVAVMLGLLTRSMSFALTIIMGFVVASMVSRGDHIFHVILALQLAFTFFALVFIGPGRLSLDQKGA